MFYFESICIEYLPINMHTWENICICTKVNLLDFSRVEQYYVVLTKESHNIKFFLQFLVSFDKKYLNRIIKGSILNNFLYFKTYISNSFMRLFFFESRHALRAVSYDLKLWVGKQLLAYIYIHMLLFAFEIRNFKFLKLIFEENVLL